MKLETIRAVELASVAGGLFNAQRERLGRAVFGKLGLDYDRTRDVSHGVEKRARDAGFPSSVGASFMGAGAAYGDIAAQYLGRPDPRASER